GCLVSARVSFTAPQQTFTSELRKSKQVILTLKGNECVLLFLTLTLLLVSQEYVRGLCDPELHKDERYPVDMHCIFAGARGLFLDRLVRDTSAEVQVPEPGRLRLLGRAESVVMAQSRVQQFVALFQEKQILPSDREPAVKRAFKSFVEERDDKYTMELLLLPSALKEELLGLVFKGNFDYFFFPSLQAPLNQTLFEERGFGVGTAGGGAVKVGGGGGIGLGPDAILLNGTRPSHKRRSSESETRDTKRQYSLERRDESPERARERERQRGDREGRGAGSSCRSKTTMGYQQEVVERVVKETGQTEDTFLVLEKIVEETKRCEKGSKGEAKERLLNSMRSPDTPKIIEQNNQDVDLAACLCMIQFWMTNVLHLTSFHLSPRVTFHSYLGSHDNYQCLLQILHLPHFILHLSAQSGYRHPASPYQTIGHMGLHGGGARAPPTNNPPAPPVTGLARFHQSLRTPYTLKLPNEPGRPELRHIIIDGSNVAMAHGLHRFFSCRGIALAVETFWRRGHREITVFVPQWRQKRDRLTTEQHFLNQLEDLRLLSFTPSREVCGQRISSHDDRFLLHLAEKTDGIIVTNDNLRDFVDTSDTWRRIIQQRLLQFTFVEDHFMIPDDPLGKRGPHLDNFLRKDNRCVCPVYVQALHSAHRTPAPSTPRPPTPLTPHSTAHWPHSGPPEWHPTRRSPSPSPSPPPQRSPGETSDLKRKLYDIFPDQKQRIDRILSDNPYMRDLNALSGLLLG
uniref:NEDD4-binding protein 1 n=1 Tax=Scophthalmus maximus TaxID=52904 RepID=A0A8D3ATR9_SCOMX